MLYGLTRQKGSSQAKKLEEGYQRVPLLDFLPIKIKTDAAPNQDDDNTVTSRMDVTVVPQPLSPRQRGPADPGPAAADRSPPESCCPRGSPAEHALPRPTWR